MITKGVNRATDTYRIFNDLRKVIDDFRIENNIPISIKICIFLSHKKEDKEACLEIGQYLEDAGIDYYLDIYDKNLQIAAVENNPHKITECLKSGIRSSTHMIVVVSEKTIKSQWVPFEIGYGHASIVDNNLETGDSKTSLNLAFLTLKEISDITIPDFLKIAEPIRGIQSLNEYLEKIKPSELELKKNLDFHHPLQGVMNKYR